MNTMGKILVFINFLFALVIIGFLAIDFARRTNWKAAFDNADAQLRIARNNTDSLAESNRKALAELGRLTADLSSHEKKAKAREDELTRRWEAEKAEFVKAEMNAKKYLLQLTDAVAEAKRRADEVTNLGKSIKDRDEKIVKLEDEREQLRTRAIQAVQERENAQDRNNALLAQVRDQQKELARLSNSPGAAGKGASAKRPPSSYVKGVIEEVYPKDNLILLSVGSDHGLAEGNTLEAYRLRPDPQYLGTVVVVDARQRKAVARLLPAEYPARRVELRVGDEVASKLSR